MVIKSRKLVESAITKIVKRVLLESEFDYMSLYNIPDDPKLDAVLKQQESERLKAEKDAYAKRIRAEGKDWNDAFLKRVKSAKSALAKLKSGSYNKHFNWNLSNEYVKEAIDAVAEMRYGAEKYAAYLRKQWQAIGGIR